jgi:plastocyanin
MKTAYVPLIILLPCLSAAPFAGAASLGVTVSDAGGKPVPSAVVTFDPAVGGDAPDKAGSFVMAQKSIKFAPYVLAVPVGATVDFPNQDRVNHHVYSFSPVQPFQFPLYGPGKKRSLRFDHPGTVALACNIHDSMSAYIRVVDEPYFATTDEHGRATLDIPAGAGTLAVWQPQLDAPEHSVSRTITMSAGPAQQTFGVKLKGEALPSGGAY